MSRPPHYNDFKGGFWTEWFDALLAWLRRDRIVVSPGSGLDVTQTPGGRLLRATTASGGGSGVTVRVKLTHGGIDAGDTGTVTLLEPGTSSTLTSAVVEDVANGYHHSDAPADSIGWITYDRGVWSLVQWECPE